MKIGVISGSHREKSQSEKVARFVAHQLSERELCDEVYIYALGGNPLPFWDEGLWSGEQRWEDALGELRREVASCDAFVIVTPEWHGMAPAGLKNFFLMFPGSGELAHKPALLIAVTTGATGGSYPVAELRMSSYKNSRICYLPEHLIVRHADKVFNADAQDNQLEQHDYLHKRLGYCLELLREYALAFTNIRASGRASLAEYNNGM
ncbi:MAG: NAD(P)H-dependent oxidoreductase [Pseudomonadota bacterium]